MVLRSECEELIAAWRALAGNAGGEGWRTIPIVPGRLLAARRFPGNEEAILVGFRSIRVPPADRLPQGRGFQVAKAEVIAQESDRIWISLSRQISGSLDLFTLMVEDIVRTLLSFSSVDEENLFNVFLSRIRAWQAFMERSRDEVLSPEQELGLYGELVILQSLLETGLPSHLVIEAWKGPLNGIHDFALGTGAIEVKSTVSPSGFLANIGSLEQLDNSLVNPLFLAGIRLALDSAGQTLPDLIDNLRNVMRDDGVPFATFNSRLLHAGFFETASKRYTRRFARVGSRLLLITDSFPRLFQGNVGIEIRKAKYEIDLDLVRQEEVQLDRALRELGIN